MTRRAGDKTSITAAYFLLGIDQGLCWSTTVIMKIDLVGPQRRGHAMGLNEFAGYFAVAITALASGYTAAAYGLRPAPFYLGIGIAGAGLLMSVFGVLTLASGLVVALRMAETLKRV